MGKKGTGERTNLAVVEEHVEGEDTDFDFDVFDFDVFAFAGHELLEWKDFLLYRVPSYRFAIEDETLSFRLDPGVELGEDVGVLLRQIFGIPREDGR